MKVINDLVNYSDLKIVQDDKYFNFSLDSVLLPNFVTLNKNIKNILDLCTGNIPIPLILSLKTKANIHAIELQDEIYELALETLKINNLESRIHLIKDNVLNLKNYFSYEFFDVITCNPPYFRYNENSNINQEDVKTIARHEKMITLEDIVNISSKFLKNNGTFSMVHRTERLIEIIMLFKKYNIEPKKIRLIYPKKDKESNLVLMEGIKCGKTGLKIMNPLIVHNHDGNYTEEVLKYFKEGD